MSQKEQLDYLLQTRNISVLKMRNSDGVIYYRIAGGMGYVNLTREQFDFVSRVIEGDIQEQQRAEAAREGE